MPNLDVMSSKLKLSLKVAQLKTSWLFIFIYIAEELEGNFQGYKVHCKCPYMKISLLRKFINLTNKIFGGAL